MKPTPLYSVHEQAGAKLVDFAGWAMPLHYGSQIAEHRAVREHAGIFDVSHMTIVDVTGKQAKDYLQYLLANDVAKLTPGKGLYTCMLNEQAGIIDDLIVYQLAEQQYRLVVNSATREKDLSWMRHHMDDFAIDIKERVDLAMLAVQGPAAITILQRLFAVDINAITSFHFTQVEEFFIARTGYTGEDGVEIILPGDEAARLWNEIISLGITPCGLGARDTLRLEAGLNLYGQDMTDETNPFESNLAWTVSLQDSQRNFIGRAALEQLKQQGISRMLVGLILTDRGVLRPQQKVVVDGIGEGVTTSGSFSPTLQQAIALARIPKTNADECFVEIRGKQLTAKIVKPPFVRRG